MYEHMHNCVHVCKNVTVILCNRYIDVLYKLSMGYAMNIEIFPFHFVSFLISLFSSHVTPLGGGWSCSWLHPRP